MASSLSDAQAEEILDALFGSTTIGPATWYVALYTTTVTPGSAGTEVDTGVWTNYARVAVTNNSTNFPAASGRTKSNGAVIDFGTATIASGTVTVKAFGLYEGLSGGSPKLTNDLTAEKVINNTDPVSIQTGALDITA